MAAPAPATLSEKFGQSDSWGLRERAMETVLPMLQPLSAVPENNAKTDEVAAL